MNVTRILGIAFAAITLQWLALQDLPLTPYGNPYIYLWAFLVIPFNTAKPNTYIIAFLIGSVVDSLEQSGGAHTMASLLTIAVKPSVENFLYGFKDENSNHRLSGLPLGNFVPMAAILVVFHHSVLFISENAGFNQASDLGLRILVSSISTTGLLILGHLLFSKRYAA